MDRRKHPRKYLLYFSRVIDRKSGILLGYLSDLTKDGLMLISETPIALGQDFDVLMDLPEDFAPREQLALSVHSLWSKPDVDPTYFNTGFNITVLDENDIGLVERIIERYGFRNA